MSRLEASAGCDFSQIGSWPGLVEWARFEEGATPPAIAGAVIIAQTGLGSVNSGGIRRRGSTDEAQ